MGKGQRARESRAGKREEMKKAAAKAIRRRRITNVLAILVTIVIVIGVVAMITLPSVLNTITLNEIAIETDNYKVDNAMMTYYVKNIYHSTSESLSSVIDSSQTLESQEYLDGTWLDYFLDIAETQVSNMLLSAENAKKNGIELSDENKKQIDENISSMKSEAKTYDVSFTTYLNRVYGKGIKEEDVRNAMEIAMIAAQYEEKFREEKEYSEEEYNSFYEEHKSNYDTADYLSYTFVSTNGDTEAAAQESLNFANAIKDSSSNVDEFKVNLEQRLLEYYKNASTKESEEEKTTEAQTNVDSDMNAIENSAAYPSTEESEQDEFTKWLFNSERKANDCTVLKSEENEKQYTVYMVVNPVHRDESIVSNIRHIFFEAEGDDEESLAATKAEAEKVIEEYNATTKKEDDFISLVEKYSTDDTIKENGGLIENLYDDGTYADELVTWSSSKDRNIGDVEIIDTADGSYVVYYQKAINPMWKLLVEQDHIEEDWSAHLEESADSFKVTVNDKSMKKINA